MGAEDRRAEIGAVLVKCEEHWRANRVPEARIAEMNGELEQHLQEALAEGKTVEDVIGDDTPGFAEAWAGATLPPEPDGPEPPWGEAPGLLSDALAATTVLVAVAHLALRSRAIPVVSEDVLSALLFALVFFYLFAEFTRSSSGAGASVWDRYPGWFRNTLVAFLLTVVVIKTFFPLPDAVLFVWPWQATFALPVVAASPRVLKRLIAPGAGRSSLEG